MMSPSRWRKLAGMVAMKRKVTEKSIARDKRNKMILQRFALGHDVDAIANEAGVTTHVVWWVAKQAGISRKRRSSVEPRNIAIVERYQAGDAVEDIAAAFDVTPQLVRAVVAVRGARRPKNADGRAIYTNSNQEELDARNKDIIETYLSGQPLGVLGDRYSLSRERVRQILVKNGVTKRHGGINSKRRVAAREHREVRAKVQEVRRAKQRALDMEVRALYDAKIPFKEMSEIMEQRYGRPIGHGSLLQRLRRTGGLNRNRSGGRPKRKLSPEEVQGVLAAYAANENVDDIAERYDIAAGTVRQMANLHKVHRSAERRGRKPSNTGQSILSDEQKVEIGKRFARYEPADEIARDYGIAVSYVGTVAKKAGYGRGTGPGVMEEFLAKLKENKLGPQD